MILSYKKYKNTIIPLNILVKIIPLGVYCHDYNTIARCPFWHDLSKKHIRKKEECLFKDTCLDNCHNCNISVSKCSILNYIEYGEYPLGDLCKVCNYNYKTPTQMENLNFN